ncbi:hypothetical protein E4634_18025 [Mangrovimicrobium sediminis]|uniref:DNA or RNA helicase of superfamily II n=1 Tax=Mangrovimicrobium sediminis TaxID=2562682 RepID=A0A4Z0LWU4_9GAMM|nr:cysteine-rich CWC family protein [Haliea sp. SAOS-164]TGD71545.1 hypothetical protein E4634_18025 [Haliea sp. SAOS-164]
MRERQTNTHSQPGDRCPLCAAENRCAIAAGQPAESCWCQRVAISAQALAALPEGEEMTRCLCPDCAGVTEGL